MKKFATILILSLIPLLSVAQQRSEYIDLQGNWMFSLDPEGSVTPSTRLVDEIRLPGTTDTNRKGNVLKDTLQTGHLSRLYSYVGKAWYKQYVDIPENWKNKRIVLFMERTKPSTVFIDGKEVGSQNNISTPQEYTLTDFLKPGRHILTVMIDNSEHRVPKQLISNSHAYTEDTQTNWNGMLGSILLKATDPLFIEDIQLTVDGTQKTLNMDTRLRGAIKKKINLNYLLIPWGADYGIVVAKQEIQPTKETQHRITLTYRNDSLDLWSEHHPTLYRMRVEIDNGDAKEKVFGLRTFKTKGTQFYINDRLTFLRGKHDACVFPLTGHVPMDVGSWRRYLQICKGYGINHIRFHSWCPPEAFFLAADIEGVYLQPELPFWGKFDKEDLSLMDFLYKEGMNILLTYGHHPSFVMFALGNELSGDIDAMKRFINGYRKIDKTKLFTFGSNTFLGYGGWNDEMDYFTTCRNGGEKWGTFDTHTRGSFSFADVFDGGIINNTYPNTLINFSKAIAGVPMPVISHEIGQFQTYPDYREINKYNGVLYPYNLKEFQRRLQKAGMLDQALDFHKASGALSVQLYKADIEMDLRTPGFGGFQLLDIQDYPGQGSAYVGILDAFMESKDLTTPTEWRQWCNEVVPLLSWKGYTWKNDAWEGDIQIANYSETSLKGKQLSWTIQYPDGRKHSSESFTINNDSIGLFTAAHVRGSLADIQKATRLDLVLQIEGTLYHNTYPMWVYPENNIQAADTKGIIITNTLSDEIVKKLQQGAKVLYMPDTTSMGKNRNDIVRTQTVGGLFQTDYWNYGMFKTISGNNKRPVSPGTLGILTDPEHPIFKDFPTDSHTNWQWFPMIKASNPSILDETEKNYRPIVQVIDNIERNHKLGLIYEYTVGKGKILVCMSPLNQLQQYPEARQLYKSILHYMQSETFQPAAHR
ncbi:MAG: beta-glycosidase [Prevotella sp.]|nr:beta-glycosidase [Prevotella sp.]